MANNCPAFHIVFDDDNDDGPTPSFLATNPCREFRKKCQARKNNQESIFV